MNVLSYFWSQYAIVFLLLQFAIEIFDFYETLTEFFGTSIILLITSWKITHFIRRKFIENGQISSLGKAVFITGCDSGFGYGHALKLNECGFTVYATVMNNASVELLTSNVRFANKLKVIKMDVTSDDEVNYAYKQVCDDLKTRGEQLWAVINNAGIASVGAFDWGTVDSYQKIFDVNVIGMVRVTRVFLPAIRESKGRIINICSIVGRITDHRCAPYCMSKHAAISFSDAARREMNKWGVKVIRIEPGTFKTYLTDSQTVRMGSNNEWSQTEESVKRVYGERYFEQLTKDMMDLMDNEYNPNIEECVNAVRDAVVEAHPKLSYMPTGNWKVNIIMFLNDYLPIELIDKFFAFMDKCKPQALQK